MFITKVMFQCLSIQAPLPRCAAPACAAAWGTCSALAALSTPALCSVSHCITIAVAGDAEAPQRPENLPCHQEQSTDTCGIQASAQESWQRHWILAAGWADPGMYLGGGTVTVGSKTRNWGELSLWPHSSRRARLVCHKVVITVPQSSKHAREWLDADQRILFWQNSNWGYKPWQRPHVPFLVKRQFQPVCISRNASALWVRSESTIFPVVCLGEDRFAITAILLTKNWRPSLHCLLLPCTDDFALLLTLLQPPYPFSDPVASENPAHAMGFLQVVYKETEAVVTFNTQPAHAATYCCQRVKFLFPLYSLAWFPCAHFSLSDPSCSQFK